MPRPGAKGTGSRVFRSLSSIGKRRQGAEAKSIAHKQHRQAETRSRSKINRADPTKGQQKERTNRQRLADDENAREEQAAKGARKLAEDDERDVEKKSSGKSNLPSNPTAERCNARTTLKQHAWHAATGDPVCVAGWSQNKLTAVLSCAINIVRLQIFR